MNELVTVLIPAYNAEKYLKSALDSIRKQTYGNLEILVIDDGSIDNTNEIIRTLQGIDSRIVLVRNDTNQGLIRTLNKGLDLAKGRYIARMDSDDIAHRERLEKQLKVMLKNPDIDMVGCLVRVIDKSNRFLYFSDAFDVDDATTASFVSMFESPIAHPGLLVKSDIIKKYKYCDKPEFQHVEDYDMFSRMLAGNVVYKCLNEYLLDYRINEQGVTIQNATSQKERTLNIIQRNTKLFLGITIEQRIYNIINFYDNSSINYQNANEAIVTLNNMLKNYELKYNYSSLRMRSWVNQRTIKIAKAFFVQKKTIKAILLLPNLFEVFTDRYTYFNIYNTTIRLINSKIR